MSKCVRYRKFDFHYVKGATDIRQPFLKPNLIDPIISHGRAKRIPLISIV